MAQANRVYVRDELCDPKSMRHRAALHAIYGKSTRFIQRKTGLSPGVIGYALKVAGVKRAEVRDGDSPFDAAIFNKTKEFMDQQLMRFLHNRLQ